jgi:hypothetical protein
MVELAIFLQVELAHQEQEQVLAVVVVEQVTHLLAQMLRLTMAVMVVPAVVVVARLLLAVLRVQAVTALFTFTTKEF